MTASIMSGESIVLASLKRTLTHDFDRSLIASLVMLLLLSLHSVSPPPIAPSPRASESVLKVANSVGRDELHSMGTNMGKFTRTKKFRLHVTALDILAQYAKYKVWIKPTAEMAFLYGNHIIKAGLGRITENTPKYVFSILNQSLFLAIPLVTFKISENQNVLSFLPNISSSNRICSCLASCLFFQVPRRCHLQHGRSADRIRHHGRINRRLPQARSNRHRCLSPGRCR